MFVIFRSFGKVSSNYFSVATTTELLRRRFFSMKLYTDKHNPFTLRVLIADKLAGTAVSVQHVQKDGMLMIVSVLFNSVVWKMSVWVQNGKINYLV